MNEIVDLSGKRILLVGSTGVLGRVYASSLAKKGANLVIADREQSDVLSYAQQLDVSGTIVDVSSEESVIDCINYCSEKLGGLDGVINNAAATGEGLMESGEVFSEFESYPLNVWEKTININLTGTFLVAREVGRLMKASNTNGSLVNVSSIYGVVGPDHRIYEGQPFKSFPGYSASKAGVIGLTKWLATKYAKNGIRITTTASGTRNNSSGNYR